MKRKYVLLLVVILLMSWLPLGRETAEEALMFVPSLRAAETLVIDAGHGGEDGGAVSPAGTVESTINLAIARKLDQMAGLFGVPTLMIREDDRSIHDPDAGSLREMKRSDLKNRVELIRQVEPATLISIHQNIYSSSKYHGAQVFYGDDRLGKPLADYTQELLVRQLDPDNHRQAARISPDVYLMKHISCRAILVECGFLSHPEEELRLRDDCYQSKLAAILLGAYLGFDSSYEGALQ